MDWQRMKKAFRDEFFTDITVHNPEGKNIFLLGLDVRQNTAGRVLREKS